MQAGIWKHYKGGYYQLLGVGQHSETNELLVVYVALENRKGPRLRCRPATMWEEIVEDEDRRRVPRFVYVGNELPPEALPKKTG